MSERLSLDEPHRRFTVDEVMRMVQAGILREDDRLELIGGELLLMSPQDPAHATIVSRLTRLLLQSYPQGTCVRVQLPLAATPWDLPEPDLVVARGAESTYANQHPAGSDCVLVIEVCRTSESRDRRKALAYAAAGVPQFWLVDLVRRRVEVHTAPDTAAGYTQVKVVAPGETLALPETTAPEIRAISLLSPGD